MLTKLIIYLKSGCVEIKIVMRKFWHQIKLVLCFKCRWKCTYRLSHNYIKVPSCLSQFYNFSAIILEFLLSHKFVLHVAKQLVYFFMSRSAGQTLTHLREFQIGIANCLHIVHAIF